MTGRHSSSFGKILATGATGNVASLLIPNLTNLGADVRALVRDGSKAQGLQDAGVEVVVGDFDKPDTLEATVSGGVGFTAAACAVPGLVASDFSPGWIRSRCQRNPFSVRSGLWSQYSQVERILLDFWVSPAFFSY